jgi:hypothetical protein
MRWVLAAAIVMAGCAPKTALVAGAVEGATGTILIGHAIVGEEPSDGFGTVGRQMEWALGISLLMTGVISMMYGLADSDQPPSSARGAAALKTE